MPDPIIPATPAPTDQRDSKAVAQNLVNGIHNKALGRTQPPETPAGTPPPDPNAGKEKYTVDGKDVWLTPEQARGYVQKGIAFEPKVTQLSHLQNEMGQFLQTLSTDPLKILTDKRIGMSPEKVLEKIFASGQISEQLKESVGKWYYENVVAPMKMTPEERRAAELEKENAKYRTKEQQAADEAIRTENRQKFEAARNQIKAMIGEAMKESGLPNNDSLLGTEMARMVAYELKAAHFRREAITPKQAIEEVKAKMRTVQRAFYDHLDGENLVKELGEANVEKVKQFLLKLVKPPAGGNPLNGNRLPSTLRNGERKTINLDDFHDQLAELKKKG